MTRLVMNAARNINAVLVFGGFVAVVWGVAAQWSTPVASIVGGAVLMATGFWPYLRPKGKP